MLLCKATFGDLADAYMQAGQQNGFQTFILAFALVAVLTAFGVCFYCYQQHRHAQLHDADVQAGVVPLIPL